ncbi:MAG: ScyD/ScyE family protein [Nocardioides sp.]
MRSPAITLISLALVAAPLATTPATAQAAADPPTVIARGLVSPLSLDVTPNGTVWASQNFPGLLTRIRPGGEPRVVYANKQGAEVGAVSVHRRIVTFALTTGEGKTYLMKRSKKGKISRVANLSRFETNRNPDAEQEYAFADADEECVAEMRRRFRPYTGIVDSHPYATTRMGNTRYVADAGGNTILGVGRNGAIRTVAVLPPQPLTVTAEVAEANGMPDCVIGQDFQFEPVPTDVETGPNGMLYVTTLPGGPEDPSLGARAAVHQINPRSGEVETIARGLITATGLDVAPNGDVYVAELFAGRISRILAGESEAKKWRSAPLPADVTWRDGRVWATRNALTGLSGEPGDRPRGQVVRYPR